MGKRIEKAFGRDKGQASNASQDNTDDDPNKTPEPYLCIGQFQPDFHELCRRNGMVVIPNVVLRPHRPPSPVTMPPVDEKAKGGRKDDKKNAPPPEPEPEAEVDENGEVIEPPPKTYVIKDKFEFFKPAVQVEMDNPDKQDTVTEMFIRSWKIDEPMMNVLKQCLVKLDRLHSINLWNTGLTDETLEILASFLPECINMRSLVLDNNPVADETYHLFLHDDSPIQHLSLRYNGITDKGIQEIGRLLGSPQRANQKLVALNLNGNRITDRGAAHLANGLRMNRTLLSLSVANNKIGDEGAKKLGEVLSRFFLTHEEIVERRKLLSEKGSPERQKSPPPGSRRADSRDRPGSVRSSHAGKTGQGKSAKAKKDGKGGKEEEKAKGGKKEPDKKDKKGSGLVPPQSQQPRRGSITPVGRRGSQAIGNTLGPSGQSNLSGRASVAASVVQDTGKGGTKKGDKGKSKGKGPSLPENEPDMPEVLNPLMDTVERHDDGSVMLIGNRTLINLNLANNQIGEEGVKALLLAIDYQTTLVQFPSHSKSGSLGLMRLCLNKNKISNESDALKQLNDLMEAKDPFYKPPAMSPDQESTKD